MLSLGLQLATSEKKMQLDVLYFNLLENPKHILRVAFDSGWLILASGMVIFAY